MIKKSVAWTIAGSDSSSGAGVQADLATFSDLGVYGCSVITAITAQNSFLISTVQPCDADILSQQIEALHSDLPPSAIKIGALGSSTAIHVVAKYLENNKKLVVCDPVLSATIGDRLLEESGMPLYIKKFFPLITLLTPNIEEAEQFLKIKIKSHSDMKAAAKKFLELGVKNVLIKGKDAKDYFLGERKGFWLENSIVYTNEVHGTGCVLSSAITAAMTLGYDLYDALVIGKMYITQEIRQAVQLGKGSLYISHQGWPSNYDDLPKITDELEHTSQAFPSCGPDSIGFYPVVDSVFWLDKLIQQGVTSIQLRIKDESKDYIKKAIKQAVALSKKNNIRLFINDYWDLAIQYQAYGVHLGQEDLHLANMQAIRDSGLRLGISTHCFYEVARAHAYQPSYIAFGPVYNTTSKSMSFSPRGLKQLAYWKSVLRYPLVAIGGINLARLPGILATDVDGIAVISAVTKSLTPDQDIQLFIEQIERKHPQYCRNIQ